MRVADFHFDLPQDLIAQHPPNTRGDSRLLRVNRASGTLIDDHFPNLPSILREGDLLILNDSRVLPARLYATRARTPHTQPSSPDPTGRIEVLLTEQLPSPIGENLWSALVRPSRKVQPGETLLFHPEPPAQNRVPHSSQPHRDPGSPASVPGSTGWGEWVPAANPGAPHLAPEMWDGPPPPPDTPHLAPKIWDGPPPPGAPHLEPEMWDGPPPLLTAEVLTTGPFGERTLRFDPDPDFLTKLDRIGHIPLPPYLHRRDEAADRSRYQTVYAQTPGSAAAPTAGLHFTPEILSELQARGIELAYLTLHVGLGTFQPVRVDRLEDIRLHTEHYTLSPATAAAINRAQREGRRIIAAGTTTTRTLEHCALGAPHLDSEMWDGLAPHSGSTSIFLQPGHPFRLVSGLLTNFHLPQSTLLMLVSAFLSEHPTQGRDRALAAYAHAIAQRYRFFSYGDCMLIL